MKELKLKEPIQAKLRQYCCPVCDKKFYINEDDVKEFEEEKVVDCPLCSVRGLLPVRLFEIEIQKIFEEE